MPRGYTGADLASMRSETGLVVQVILSEVAVDVLETAQVLSSDLAKPEPRLFQTSSTVIVAGLNAN